jgi:phosphate:Na+ symporter
VEQFDVSAVISLLGELAENDVRAAQAVIDARDEVNEQSRAVDRHLAARLVADAPNRLAAFRLETDVVENLKRVYYFAMRIGKIVADGEEDGTNMEGLERDTEALEVPAGVVT